MLSLHDALSICPRYAVAAIVASSCNTAEHHLAARPDAEAELDIDVFAMKDELAADGDAALVRAQVIASVGEAKGVAESLQRLAAIAMEELLGLLVIADALLRAHRKGGFASPVGHPVHADAAKQTDRTSVV